MTRVPTARNGSLRAISERPVRERRAEAQRSGAADPACVLVGEVTRLRGGDVRLDRPPLTLQIQSSPTGAVRVQSEVSETPNTALIQAIRLFPAREGSWRSCRLFVCRQVAERCAGSQTAVDTGGTAVNGIPPAQRPRGRVARRPGGRHCSGEAAPTDVSRLVSRRGRAAPVAGRARASPRGGSA